jgi:hypothetical protein
MAAMVTSRSASESLRSSMRVTKASVRASNRIYECQKARLVAQTDKGADTRSADNHCSEYSHPEKGAGVLHPHGCCINAATKKRLFPGVSDSSGRLQRARPARSWWHRTGVEPKFA